MSSEVAGFDGNYSKQFGSMSGGKRKKGNGHKDTCACPICKNMMKKGKKGGVLLVGGTLPEAAKKLREAADALEDTKAVADGEKAAVADADAAMDTVAATDADADADEETDMGGGRRRSSKRGKGRKSKKGGKKRAKKGGKNSKKRGRKSRRY